MSPPPPPPPPPFRRDGPVTGSRVASEHALSATAVASGRYEGLTAVFIETAGRRGGVRRRGSGRRTARAGRSHAPQVTALKAPQTRRNAGLAPLSERSPHERTAGRRAAATGVCRLGAAGGWTS